MQSRMAGPSVTVVVQVVLVLVVVLCSTTAVVQVQAQTPAPIIAVAATTAVPTVTSVAVVPGVSPAAPVAATTPSSNDTTSSSSSSSSSQQWGGCVGRNGAADRVRLGQATRICWHVANGVQWSAGVDYVRAAFEPVADTYARLHIPNCTSCVTHLYTCIYGIAAIHVYIYGSLLWMEFCLCEFVFRQV
jgi:hypothetical protein